MTRSNLRRKARFVRIAVLLTATVFAPVACVSKVTQTFGDGLTAAGTAGILGPNSQVVSALGTSIAFFGDLVGLLTAR